MQGRFNALLTDLYQLTMAQGYWKNRKEEQEATFNLYFRSLPFKGNYAIACGLSSAIDFLKNWRFTLKEIQYLKNLKNANGSPLFEEEFLAYLSTLRFTCDIEAIPEGTLVFPNEPLIKITGPIIQAQLLETALLNIMNFQTLIATKASRICEAAGDDSVIEFGLRRAQGPNGGLSASRAAYIGGCTATSNAAAGMEYGIPVIGTHAHSWVSSFENEEDAFTALAKAMPNSVSFLVDTYDTKEGVLNAIKVAKQLNVALQSIRLDSGDLAQLSIYARAKLDENGFLKTKIVASNDLDEDSIKQLKATGAKIDIWGIGTKLATSYNQPALGGVYKLTKFAGEPKIKLSEESHKTSIPGSLQVERYSDPQNPFLFDVIHDVDTPIEASYNAVSLNDSKSSIEVTANQSKNAKNILTLIFKEGELVYKEPDIQTIRAHAKEQLHLFTLAYQNNRAYSVYLQENLFNLRQRMIMKYKNNSIVPFKPPATSSQPGMFKPTTQTRNEEIINPKKLNCMIK